MINLKVTLEELWEHPKGALFKIIKNHPRKVGEAIYFALKRGEAIYFDVFFRYYTVTMMKMSKPGWVYPGFHIVFWMTIWGIRVTLTFETPKLRRRKK